MWRRAPHNGLDLRRCTPLCGAGTPHNGPDPWRGDADVCQLYYFKSFSPG